MYRRIKYTDNIFGAKCRRGPKTFERDTMAGGCDEESVSASTELAESSQHMLMNMVRHWYTNDSLCLIGARLGFVWAHENLSSRCRC